MTWTPPEALVERVAKTLARAKAFTHYHPSREREIKTAVAVLDASPIGELVEALTEAELYFTRIALMSGRSHEKSVIAGEGRAKALAALARVRGGSDNG